MYRCGQLCVCFCGEDSILSNLAPYDLTLFIHGAKHEFNSSEQAYQWSKLHWLRLHQEAELLLNHTSPKQVMFAARTALTSERENLKQNPTQLVAFQDLEAAWKSHYATQVLQDLAIRKATAFPTFANELQINRNKLFIEATKDSFWGCGYTAGQIRNMSEAHLVQNIRGSNTMGKILSTVAEQLYLRDVDAVIIAPLQYEQFREGHKQF